MTRKWLPRPWKTKQQQIVVSTRKKTTLLGCALNQVFICILNPIEELFLEKFVRKLTNVGQQTPLHWACMNENGEIVDLLLKHGADVCANIGSQGFCQETPLIFAVQKGNTEVRTSDFPLPSRL